MHFALKAGPLLLFLDVETLVTTFNMKLWCNDVLPAWSSVLLCPYLESTFPLPEPDSGWSAEDIPASSLHSRCCLWWVSVRLEERGGTRWQEPSFSWAPLAVMGVRPGIGTLCQCVVSFLWEGTLAYVFQDSNWDFPEVCSLPTMEGHVSSRQAFLQLVFVFRFHRWDHSLVL